MTQPSCAPSYLTHHVPSNSPTVTSPIPTAYRPAPTPPQPVTPALDRSTSQRAPSKASKSSDQLGRANTTRDNKRTPAVTSPYSSQGQQQQQQQQAQAQAHKKPPLVSNSSDSSTKQVSHRERERDPRTAAQHQPQSPAAANLAKTAGGVATPRRREKKDPAKDQDIIRQLQQICTDADPTRLYRNLVKIGQG
jgi:p21-activated kinase 1